MRRRLVRRGLYHPPGILARHARRAGRQAVRLGVVQGCHRRPFFPWPMAAAELPRQATTPRRGCPFEPPGPPPSQTPVRSTVPSGSLGTEPVGTTPRQFDPPPRFTVVGDSASVPAPALPPRPPWFGVCACCCARRGTAAASITEAMRETLTVSTSNTSGPYQLIEWQRKLPQGMARHKFSHAANLHLRFTSGRRLLPGHVCGVVGRPAALPQPVLEERDEDGECADAGKRAHDDRTAHESGFGVELRGQDRRQHGGGHGGDDDDRLLHNAIEA